MLLGQATQVLEELAASAVVHSATKPDFVTDKSDVNRSSKKPVSDLYTSVQYADPSVPSIVLSIVPVQFCESPESLANWTGEEQSADAQLLIVTKSSFNSVLKEEKKTSITDVDEMSQVQFS